MTLSSSGAPTSASPRPRIGVPAACGGDSLPVAGGSRTPTRDQSVVLPLAGMIAVTLTAAVSVVALAVHFVVAGEARNALGFRFPGVPATFQTAAIIFAANLRVLAGMFGALAVAQLLARSTDRATTPLRWLLGLLQLLVAGQVAVNTLLVGGALGAYGGRMVRAMLPHGPVELAAWSVALALVIAGCRRPLRARELAGWGIVSVGLLAVAAIVETWVAL